MISTTRNLIISLCALAAIGSGVTGCSPQPKTANTRKPSHDLFSNRPIEAVPDLYVITLEAPPLLTKATRGASGWKIDEEDKRKVLEEQALFEVKLKNALPQAQIIYRYRMTLNGVALYAPPDAVTELDNMPFVKSITHVRQMGRPEQLAKTLNTTTPQEVNSATFIGAAAAYKQGITGRGVRVGILDTGIDYTHKMLGGSGLKDDFKVIDPAKPSAQFPNSKVTGGVDLVGTDFNAASPLAEKRLPKPDANPIDEGGHGTHVGGTVAGLGDGVNTYDGVAPDAQLHAIKVFGKGGSTTDAVVIAGFEYAVDPNGDLNPDDQLDVVNLSLGGGFGQPQILYTEAVRTVSRAGTVVVASAGNSGPVDYIVGAPGTSDEALSVAASVDGSPHNWQFAAVRFISPNNSNWMAKATEGPVSKPIAEIDPTEGELVDIGMADVDLTDEVKAQLKGQVALIIRGKVPFIEKLKRAADAGAIGAVVYNNEPGKPIPMGGEGKVEIPAIMVSQALGLKIKDEMKAGAVRIQFKTGQKIEEPEIIDTITDFSSKGPRSEDNLMKPEIAAPGQRIISAAMGEGTGSVQMDGTSMAAPHVAGVMALLKQARPDLNSAELKSLAMNTAKPLVSKNVAVPISLQGAGRVQIAEALTTPIAITPNSWSLGRVQIEDSLKQSKTFRLKNISPNPVELTVETQSSAGLVLTAPKSVSIPANGETEITVNAEFTLVSPDKFALEANGRVLFRDGNTLVSQIPALAIRTQASDIRGSGDPTSVQLTNESPIAGIALAFNLLGEDPRKADPKPTETWKGRSCDLQSVGYRILKKNSKDGPKDVIQFAFKLYTPLTTWHLCEVSVLIDQNGDDIADQELSGISAMGLEGVNAAAFATVLLDAGKARAIRLAYEKELASGKQDATANYQPALLSASPMAPFAHSTVALIETPLEGLSKTADGKLRIKAASVAGGGDVIESDDYLGGTLGEWKEIAASAEAQPYYGMDELTKVTKATSSGVKLSKGAGDGKLVLYYPFNNLDAANGVDGQSQVIE